MLHAQEKFIYFGSMCTIMYGYAHLSVSSCGLCKARTLMIWSFDALQGNTMGSGDNGGVNHGFMIKLTINTIK